MKKIIGSESVISYHKQIDVYDSTNSTVYHQSVRINRDYYDVIAFSIREEINADFPNVKEYCPEGKYYAKTWLTELKCNRYVFLKLTQAHYLKWIMDIDLKNDNTYIIVDNIK